VKDWLIDDAGVGAKELQRRIKDKHKIEVNYKRVYVGKELALKQLYGNWDKSFDNLFKFKEEIESSCPESFVVIDHHTVNEKIKFRRLFFALKPCVDGFLKGCRPYLAVDSTFLTGKFKGQLAAAIAVDAHNWMYPVAFGVMDSETNENWSWLMEKLRAAIGTPRVKEAFPIVEHRECMFHLVNNFKKRWHGKIFDDNLWPATYAWNSYAFNKHWLAMASAKPDAMAWVRKNHNKIWSRCQFNTLTKVDYVTNNMAESFNNWMKGHKGLNLDDLMDVIRQKLMVKWNKRRISNKLEGNILPHIVKQLKQQSFHLNMEVTNSFDAISEVVVKGGNGFRYSVNLEARRCSCRECQVSRKPCSHAIVTITSFRNEKIEDYIDMCYSVEKFKATYEGVIPAIPDKSQ
jgi:hypothetical protein